MDNNTDNCYFVTIVVLDLGTTLPELLFEKKRPMPAVEQLMTSCRIEVSFDRTENGRLQFQEGNRFPGLGGIPWSDIPE